MRETSIFEVLHLGSFFFLCNFNRVSKSRFTKESVHARNSFYSLYPHRNTVFIIVDLEVSQEKTTKSLSHTRITCN